MRLSNSLVVGVAAVLLASGNALAPATGAGQATVSRLASLESGNQIDGLANENKRSLRGREAADNDDGAVDEERYQQWKIICSKNLCDYPAIVLNRSGV
ncbi:hypothetical protein PHYSODRAFT_286080 [Phytophthora sojae]|uniref:RxLR effector protein n=2 Tax=Phytophthora sojae TaxID=67593 RepID=G4ZEH5_PHYSP|nr:hypothetical protein PHYSODRAFT_286080 [Phytophthora sojae]AEK80527.1 Avh34 [Phytophthora sojae]AEK80528.1 Avh34 [Phytophthora sojae]AEK80529.1 Avh34 [Phytophthora sojae]EGZ18440.1 hypothetical protein PHYSODRAFT_286080 [Phytophthora sojae]|eukprot:XP_009527498.1 hypothetical protein PHYSODRAFT_286080 [Phytophthora sojae]